MEIGKRSNIVLWTGVAAAAAGIVAAVAIAGLRDNSSRTVSAADRLRDVKEVLDDCYSKIHEIESRIPRADPAEPSAQTNGRSVTA